MNELLFVSLIIIVISGGDSIRHIIISGELENGFLMGLLEVVKSETRRCRSCGGRQNISGVCCNLFSGK